MWPLLRTALFTIVVPGTVVLYVPYRLLGAPNRAIFQLVTPLGWLAVPLFLAGLALYLRCAWDFATRGRGTPGPWDPPVYLVGNGLYRVMRNPMYVGVVSMIAAEAAAFRSLVLTEYVVVVWVCFHLMVVLYEEPALRHTFGESYEAYVKSTPRWVPRIR
jgi:protein-S-isoprenylcysteine O-methyltransferase Ste14